ncbi:MAG: sulfite exporter TauE/SafE family protein [Opitutaceae bacterium]|jgi:sulfite exporter TauE/SafE|nr:sulfite exporter TauE/SafE family protein [Opitutaceae bacterium]
MTLADYTTVLVMGLLGSGHCIGMCAPFALAVGAGAGAGGGGGGGGGRRLGAVTRHLAYQFGKASTYAFIGLLLLAAATSLAGNSGMPMADARRFIAGLAGGLMILIGLGYALEWRPVMFAAAAGRVGGRACGLARSLWQSTSPWKSVFIGWLNGFIPCGLSLPALGFLAAQGTATGVVAGAYVFGLGTMPGLLLLTLAGRRITASRRRWLTRIAGLTLVVLGALLILRATGLLTHGGHDGHAPPDGHEGLPLPPHVADSLRGPLRKEFHVAGFLARAAH